VKRTDERPLSIYGLKPRFQAFLRPFVRHLHPFGITANQVTITACLGSIGVGVFLIHAPRPAFLLLPIWMLVRMALNAIDGMLAREFGQKSVLGTFLNELTDVLSDAALYVPFAFVAPFTWLAVCGVIFASTVSELTGVVAVMAGASRRYDGPMGKSDRALVFSVLAIWVALQAPLPAWSNFIMWITAALLVLTIVNRVRAGIYESAQPSMVAP
jgi:CDP-diacylglycerol--glycerol-3-phosphate 3-phosphatidyltransferase